MQTYISTTPFGRRAMTLGQIASQRLAKALPKGAIANKWKVFQHIREARELIGATDRSLAILNALLSFHRETELAAGGELIVWPSNEQLIARANGISPATLRRHLAVLVECGLIIRRDSPNGKRFARRNRGGDVEQAYGFDLSPIVARADEFRDLAEAVQAEKLAFRVAKERLTLLRRDIVKMIDAGIEEAVPGNWGRVLQTYQAIISRLPRTAPRQLIEDICAELHTLHAEIREVLESFTKTEDSSANESHSERHIQNSNPESNFESEKSFRKKKEASGSAGETDNVRSLPKRDLPLSIVLDACPNLREIVQPNEIRQWRDLLAAAELVRTMLGISPSAWQDAREVMGEVQAAIALGAIYQRADQINTAGGYLRSLTDKAREGKFSTWPMVMALLRAKLDESKRRQDSPERSSEAAPRLEVSDSLVRSLQKPKRRL
ncbi:plasmid replication protein RepC [Agrobacterium tumefaciens]|uniref:plasmid replication protein RepC n=1 Tax=Agrobacterium tumefaciens TaxID=358 RepID=UPI002243EC57|nr:plasmid replication protein RepC [Agrobacterium tumefaciens]MCW8060566.1 replication initiation protein RepC [Agrobacterium tumefaciens]MCW8146009.1 replication initiation protein RepC [Agrobacterium tumefaciens]